MKSSSKRCDVMALQPRYHIINPGVGGTAIGFVLDNLDDRDVLGPLEKRQRILHRTTRLASVFPGNHGAVQLERLGFGGHDENRPSGLHHQISGIVSIMRVWQQTIVACVGHDKIRGTRLRSHVIAWSRHCRSPLNLQGALRRHMPKTRFYIGEPLSNFGMLPLHKTFGR